MAAVGHHGMVHSDVGGQAAWHGMQQWDPRAHARWQGKPAQQRGASPATDQLAGHADDGEATTTWPEMVARGKTGASVLAMAGHAHSDPTCHGTTAAMGQHGAEGVASADLDGVAGPEKARLRRTTRRRDEARAWEGMRLRLTCLPTARTEAVQPRALVAGQGARRQRASVGHCGS